MKANDMEKVATHGSNMKYFKQHFESGTEEWTVYGCYEEKDITKVGDFLCKVHEVFNNTDSDHIQHNVYEDYYEPDEVTHITEKEYTDVINKLHEADGYYDKADEVLKKLI